MNCSELSQKLDPYLDGELDLTASLALEEHLASCPACRQLRDQQQNLITLTEEELPRFQAPFFLKTRIRASLRAEEPRPAMNTWWRFWPATWVYAGAFALVVITLFLFFWLKPSTSLFQEVIADHIRSLQVNHLMDVASTDQHTVKPWFVGKLTYSPTVIDLSNSGYPLIGGRLDVLRHQEVSAIVYQRRKHYINLFIYPSDPTILKDQFYQNEGYHVFIWSRSGMNYAAVSELNEKELREFVSLIQAQTN